MSDLNLYEVSDLETWLASCKDRLFGRSILWIARQDWSSDAQRSDIVGISDRGDLVVVELKRGKAAEAAVTQVVGYAAEYQSLAPRDLARLYHEHSQKIGRTTLIDPALSLEDAEARISAHVVEGQEVNESQILLIFAEAFEDRTLSICDYLSRSAGEATFSIELWQFGIHPMSVAGAEDEKIFIVEQILPPPSIRAQVEAEREAAKTRKYARDPRRIEFMQSLIGYLQPRDHPLYRSPGQSYAGYIKISGVEIEFQVPRGNRHPRLSLPNSVQLDEDVDREYELKRGAGEDGFWWIEFSKFDANNLQFSDKFGDDLIRVIERLKVAST